MFKNSLNHILDIIKGKKAVIVGAGKYGQELAGILIDEAVPVASFFDNDDKKNGLSIYGIPVEKPHKYEEKNILYIIATDIDFFRYQLKKQLLALGILEAEILCYFPHRCLEYHATLRPDEYKTAIEEMYYEQVGKKMNWNNPSTYNEIMCWEKLNLNDDYYADLADKNKVRAWVKERIGAEHLTKQLAVWETIDDIRIEDLPNRFVLKTNNGSDRNILITDKREADWGLIKEKLEYWLSSNYQFGSFDMYYGKIKPCIIAEEYLEGVAESLYEYNVLCFQGKPRYIVCIKGSHRPECTAAFYDTKWKKQPFSLGWSLDIYEAPRPKQLDEMLSLSEKLSEEFDHVRVDWYIMPDGRILFGELTFRTWGGMLPFIPSKYDEFLGRLIPKKRKGCSNE